MRALHLKVVGPWSSFTNMQLQFVTGEFTGEEFDWDFSNMIEADFYIGME